MKRLFTFIALVAMSIGTWAWTWTGTTPAGGNSYYLYSKNQSGFLKASGDDWDEPSYGTWGLATHGSGDAGSGRFTFTSSAGKQIAMWRTGTMFYTYYVSASANDKTGDAIQMTIGLNNGYYSIYRSNKSSNWSGDRNISTTPNGIQRAKDASYEWLFVDDAEMAVYNKRVISFVANPMYEGENGTVDHVDATDSLANVGANNQPHAKTVTFKAVAKPGYVFAGWSETEGGEFVSTEANYEVNVTFSGDVTVSNSITKTLYANFEVGVVTPTIEKVIDKLDWYTTYNVADLFDSKNKESALVVKNGEDVITSFTTKNESSITLTVSQDPVEGKYYAVEDTSFTFAVAPASACEPVVILSNAAESSKIEESATAVYSLGFAADVRSISYEFKTSFASNKTIYLDQLVDGTWKNVWSSTNRPTGYTPNTVNLSANHESATALRFRMSGGGTGSMWVKNVVINGENGISVSEKRDTTLAEVNDLTNIDGGVIELGYTSVATIQYEITDVAATKGNATVVLTPQETIDNECGDYGAYHFAVSATCTERVSVITANAHFFTSDGYDKVVPVKVELTKQSQTLSWTSAENIEINVDGELRASATATSDLDVAYSSSNESVVKYENGAWVVVGAGEATIYADQAGNDSYEAATQISKQVTVKKLTQTLSWSDEVNTIFDNAELNVTATATSGLAVTYGSNNANVIKYEDGAWVVAGVGTATIHASQAGNDTYQAANQIYMTITVLSAQTSRESGEDAWTNMPGETESETASMYVTTNGETLITKTAQYKHGTICLPYSGTVSGATLYRLVNSEKDEVGNVNGLVFEFLGEDAASSCNFEAGMPYVYFANDAQQAWTRTSNTSEDVQAKSLSNGLTGTYERKKLTNNEYFLYTADDSFHKAGTNVVVPAFRAYITTDDMENVADLQTPGKAQIRFGFEGYKPVATGMENAVVMNATKALVNGKIVIIRGDKAYTINGSKLK